MKKKILVNDPARTALVKQILNEGKPSAEEIAQFTIRLNQILAPFGMHADESWSEYSFACWYLEKPATGLAWLNPFRESNVASLGDDFSWFSINPDGPVEYDGCLPIVDAITKEFATKPKIGYQMTYQGGL